MKKVNFKKVVLLSVSAASLLVGLTGCNDTAAAKAQNEKIVTKQQYKNNYSFNGRGLKIDFKAYKFNNKLNYVVTTKLTKKSRVNVAAYRIKKCKSDTITAWLYNSRNVYKLRKNSGRVIYRKHTNGARVNVSAWWNGKKTEYIIQTETAKRLNYNYAYNVNKNGITDGVTIAMGENAAE